MKSAVLLILFFIVTLCSAQTRELPKIEIESVNQDGSYILIIDGRRFRAFNEKQTRVIGEMQSERNSYRQSFYECREQLLRSNEGE